MFPDLQQNLLKRITFKVTVNDKSNVNVELTLFATFNKNLGRVILDVI